MNTPGEPKVTGVELAAVVVLESTRLVVPPPLTMVVPVGMPGPEIPSPLNVPAPDATVTLPLPLLKMAVVDGPAEPKVTAAALAVAVALESTRLAVPPPLTMVVPGGMPAPETIWWLNVPVPAASVPAERVTLVLPLAKVAGYCKAVVGPEAILSAPAPDLTSSSVAVPEPSTVLGSMMIELMTTVFCAL